MEVREERELKELRETFARGVELFKQRQYKEALSVFAGIVQEYESSEFYSILEIEGRSKVYRKICDAKLNPVKLELNDDKDYLGDGIYQLNIGNLDKALERFNYLKEKNYRDPSYLNYLISLGYLKKGNAEACLNHLEQAIDQDEFYKIIAYNEPDFDSLFENQRYSTLTEIGEGD